MIQELLHPNHKDLITAAFDLVFVWMGWKNLVAIHRDKHVAGFDWRNVVLFAVWNLWSIIVIYPDAKLYLANIVNVVYLVLQLAWIWAAVYYLRSSPRVED